MAEIMLSNTEEIGKKPKKRLPTSLTITLFILCIILAGGLGFLYSKYRKSQHEYEQSQEELSRLSDPTYISQLQQESVTTTVENLRRHILLPEGEEPTIATIIDVDALREENPDFYKDAQNGDQLVIYTTKAFLYREGEDIIINVAPVFLEPEADAAAEPEAD